MKKTAKQPSVVGGIPTLYDANLSLLTWSQLRNEHGKASAPIGDRFLLSSPSTRDGNPPLEQFQSCETLVIAPPQRQPLESSMTSVNGGASMHARNARHEPTTRPS